MENINFGELMKKVAELKKGGKFDLSLDEDLSIAVMNLVSLEEHFFFTAEKTKKDEYLDWLRDTREMRKQLLEKLIDKHEGETWCVSKHLLAASMRLMEVGTKLEGAGKRGEAKKMFDGAYKLYALFWSLRLKLLNTKGLKKIGDDKLNIHDEKGNGGKPWKFEDIVSKLVDCCKE
ncbi:MAG: hypothetical protein ABSF47_02490 [Minisyncoccia bacterium]|jgi:hypothetical protein